MTGRYNEADIAFALAPKSGTLVDVGAHQGGSLRRFARAGWEVHAFEPDPANRAILERVAASWPRVHVDSRAITERDADEVQLFTSDVSSGISTLTPFHASHTPTTTIRTVRLDSYLVTAQTVTVLKTDAEGHDLPVLRTFPWDRLHPSVVICEFEDRKTIPLGYCYEDLARFLVARGYAVLVSEWWPVAHYGRRHRWRQIERFPTELADPAGWGNLIAVDPPLADHAVRIARRMSWPTRMLDAFRHVAARQ